MKLKRERVWSELYGTLRKGEYRIVKEIYKQKESNKQKEINGDIVGEYISVEFTI